MKDEPLVSGEDRETEILQCLEAAINKTKLCDDIVIVMQYKEGGFQWYAPNSSTVANTNWMLDTLKSHLLRTKQEDE